MGLNDLYMAIGEKTMQLNEIKDLKNGIRRCMVYDSVWTFVCLRFLITGFRSFGFIFICSSCWYPFFLQDRR